jgi:hypothetical protein
VIVRVYFEEVVQDDEKHSGASEEDGERVELAVGDHGEGDGASCIVGWTGGGAAELSARPMDETKALETYEGCMRWGCSSVGNVRRLFVALCLTTGVHVKATLELRECRRRQGWL